MEGALGALSYQLDLSAREIPDPTIQPKKLRLAVSPISVANTLHLTFYDDVNVMSHALNLKSLGFAMVANQSRGRYAFLWYQSKEAT